MEIEQYTAFWVELDPTRGKEIQKTRPCVVISPNEMNNTLGTVIVAPMTSKFHAIPTRIEVKTKGKTGYVALDQIRTIDKSRLGTLIAKLSTKEVHKIKTAIHTMLVE